LSEYVREGVRKGA